MYVGLGRALAQRMLDDANRLNPVTDPGGRDWPSCELCDHAWHGLECTATTSCFCVSSFVEVPC